MLDGFDWNVVRSIFKNMISGLQLDLFSAEENISFLWLIWKNFKQAWEFFFLSSKFGLSCFSKFVLFETAYA